MSTYRKKLIEVALPLDAINAASAKEKSIHHGHPSTLHLWWARRPLATARAVIFAQMVDDPSSCSEQFPTEEEQEKERQRLFRIIEELVKWENTTNEKVLQQARDEIWQSWRRACADNADHPQARELFDQDNLPAFHDPFAGGGALPLEAQRLGLKSYASDLNPVAVLINKAMIEIPPKFAGKPPVNPEAGKEKSLITRQWTGAQGLAEDVRYYGQWMRDEAEKQIGHLYPNVEITAEIASERPDLKSLVGREFIVLATLWTRTVTCPNPACASTMPLLSTFVLSSKKGCEWYLHPQTKGQNVQFLVSTDPPPNQDFKRGYKRGTSGVFECAHCGTITTRDYVAGQATTVGLSSIQTAIVVRGDKSRIYLPAGVLPTPEDIPTPDLAGLDVELAPNPRDLWCRNFGLRTPADQFTKRQLVALMTFADSVKQVCTKIHEDSVAIGLADDGKPLHSGGTGATAYAEGVGVYLGLAASKEAMFIVTQARWRPGEGKSAPAFGRQALPMVWDFADLNPFAGAGGDFMGIIDGIVKTIRGGPSAPTGQATQVNAASQQLSLDKIVSTDPPYYDNIGYADLSDFFYVWLRRALRPTFPDLLATLAAPKDEELVAMPYRHGNKKKAETYFLDGMTRAMSRLAEQIHPAFPVTIYYAFKQSESEAITGWETFLDSIIRAGFAISGTWPMRTENRTRLVGMVTNALASSIVLVCRPRTDDSPTVTRQEFVSALKAELPEALNYLQLGNIAPVDLSQAAIGPGMAVFTRYGKVLDAEGRPLLIRTALTLINQILDEALTEHDGALDSDSRWALAWFEESGFAEGEFGMAETLSKAKNTSVAGMIEAGIIASAAGKVRLFRPDELPVDWDPASDRRLTVWEATHHLIKRRDEQGDQATASLLAKLGPAAEQAKSLAYRLYNTCERKGWAEEAQAYNGLVLAWPELERLAGETSDQPSQAGLFE